MPTRTVSGPPKGWRSVDREVDARGRSRARRGSGASRGRRRRRGRSATVSPTSTSSSERVGALGEVEVGARDRVAVRVELGVAELGGDPLGELVGEHVLEQLGLLVDEVPGDVEHLDEEQLEQAVVAQRPQRDAAALLGERARRW